jgi:hypothetical protein
VLAAGRRDGAVHVDVGDLVVEQKAPAAGPQLGAHRVDALHQLDDVVLAEAPAVVAFGGRVRGQLGAEGVHGGAVVPQPLEVLSLEPASRRPRRG